MRELKHPCGYFVREDGAVRSKTGKTLKLTVSKKTGYVCLSKGLCHRLVWETFNGEIPKGLAINHKNGIKTDNRLVNLELVTYSENMIHAFRTGLAKPGKGENNSMAKLSKEDFLEICSLLKMGWSNGDIAEEYGIHDRYVSLIRHKRRWKDHFPEWYSPVDSPVKLPVSVETAITTLNLCFNTKMRNKEIADRVGIDKSTVSRIRSGKTWRTFKDLYYMDCNDHRNHTEEVEGSRVGHQAGPKSEEP